MQCNTWITQIDEDEPIAGEHASKALHFFQSERTVEVAVGFNKLVGSSNANLDLRSTFDQMESSKHKLGENDTMSSSNYLVASPVPIKAPRDISRAPKD